MDAAALLRSQGWRGKGYTLHSSDNSVGLASRLLVSNNTDRRGIGQNQHHTNDQWWLTAFDEKLKSLDTSQKGRVVQSGTGGKLDAIAAAATGKGKYAGANGLYTAFVSGGLMDGTLTPDEEQTDATPACEEHESVPGLEDGPRRGSKVGETKEERRPRREAKRWRKAAREERRAAKLEREYKQEEQDELADGAATKAASIAAKGTESPAESKQDRRARRAERAARKGERRGSKKSKRAG